MFDKKVSNLLSTVEDNKFIKEGMKISSETVSGNGAVKYSTSGNDFVDQFAAISYYKEPRTYEEVSKDMSLLWSQDPLLCLKLAVYTRLITRKSKVVQDDNTFILEVQRGQGLKNEGIMRTLWIAVNYPSIFKYNIPFFIATGSWKDIFQMLSLDLQYHGWTDRKLDWNFLLLVIAVGLYNSETTHLVRKYLPTIRTNKNCRTIESQANTLIGRWIARSIFSNFEKEAAYKEYRKLKSSGVAHKWQQQISRQLYNEISFDSIAGRALSLLVNSKFLQNHNLVDKYTEWIQSKSTAKYTGFVFELFKPLGENIETKHIESYKEKTINAQFEQLVQTGKENVNTNSKLIVVRDTSGSMWSSARGCNMSSFDIAKAMALYFSQFLTGDFANSYIEFSDRAVMHKWKGNTACDMWINDRCGSLGNTNFQSVIDLFITLKQAGVSEEDFPTGLLCVSDGELDYCGDSSNFNSAISKLKSAHFSDKFVDNFKIILWDIPNSYYGSNSVKFEDFADAPNFYYMSGYDPAAVSFILGNSEFKSSPKNAEELFEAAMNQDILNYLKIIK